MSRLDFGLEAGTQPKPRRSLRSLGGLNVKITKQTNKGLGSTFFREGLLAPDERAKRGINTQKRHLGDGVIVMSGKQQLNAVKFRVRETALMVGKFTVHEMVQATGLNPESVRTEIQRMKREGLLVTEELPRTRERPKVVGKRPSLYRLTSDSQKRFEMARQLTSFYAPSRSSNRPTSRHYVTATRLLDRLMAERDSDERARRELMVRAAEALDYAWYDENEPRESPIGAFIDREKARLHYVREEFSQAKSLFELARQRFVTASVLEEAERIDAYLEAINLRKSWTPSQSVRALNGYTQKALKALRNSKSNSWAQHPIVALLSSLTARLTGQLKEVPSPPAVTYMAAAEGTYRVSPPSLPNMRGVVRHGVIKMATSSSIEQYPEYGVLKETARIAAHSTPNYSTAGEAQMPLGVSAAQQYFQSQQSLLGAGQLSARHTDLHGQHLKQQEDKIFARIGDLVLARIE